MPLPGKTFSKGHMLPATNAFMPNINSVKIALLQAVFLKWITP